jgi:hypothetical protein
MHLGRVFLQVNVIEANPAKGGIDVATDTEGFVFLRNLVTFGKIWIEVMFAIKVRKTWNLTVHSEAKENSILYSLPVWYWQSAW